MRARQVQLALLTLIIAAGGFLVRWSDPWEPRAVTDSLQYARAAYHLSGQPTDLAYRSAISLVCGEWRRVRTPPSGFVPTVAVPRETVSHECSGPPAAPRVDVRYQRIFDARPGYPALVAAALPVLGRHAFAAVTAGLAVLDGLALVAALLQSGAGWGGALAAELLLFALPSGLWITRVAPEGGMVLGLLVGLLGAGLTRSAGRRVLGMVLVVAGAAVAFVFKPVNGLTLGGALAAAATVGLLAARREWRSEARRPWVAVAGAGLVAVLVLVAANALLRWPGLDYTLQDTVTRHFTAPAVEHVWPAILQLDRQLVRQVFLPAMASGLLPLILVAAAWGLLSRLRLWALPWLAVGLSAVAVTLVHPVRSEAPRLLLPLWLVTAVGLGLLATRHQATVAADAGPHPAEAAALHPVEP